MIYIYFNGQAFEKRGDCHVYLDFLFENTLTITRLWKKESAVISTPWTKHINAGQL